MQLKHGGAHPSTRDHSGASLELSLEEHRQLGFLSPNDLFFSPHEETGQLEGSS